MESSFTMHVGGEKPTTYKGGEKSGKGADDERNARYDVGMSVGLMDIDGVKSFLKIGKTAVYTLINSNALPSVKINGRRLFRPKDVIDFVNNLPTSEEEEEEEDYDR